MLLLLWFGHTYAHKSCASDLWVQGIHTMSRETPSRLRSKQALTSTVSQCQSTDSENHNYLHTLKRGFTATPARCWAALYDVGCLSFRAAKSVLHVLTPLSDWGEYAMYRASFEIGE